MLRLFTNEYGMDIAIPQPVQHLRDTSVSLRSPGAAHGHLGSFAGRSHQLRPRRPPIHEQRVVSQLPLCADLSPLGPERGVQLAVGQQAGLQAGEELQQVASFREAQRGSLDAVLAHKHHRAPTVHWRKREQHHRHVLLLGSKVA